MGLVDVCVARALVVCCRKKEWWGFEKVRLGVEGRNFRVFRRGGWPNDGLVGVVGCKVLRRVGSAWKCVCVGGRVVVREFALKK